MSAQGTRDVAAADELRTAMAQRSGTVGEAVTQLDEWAIALGTLRVSV